MKADKYCYYKDGFKYQLDRSFHIQLNIGISQNAVTVPGYIQLTVTGNMTIFRGYAWDGPSGPTWDDYKNIRPSLVHDALYQLMRNKLISRKYRKYADELLYQMLRQDGMSKFRAWYYLRGVRKFSEKYTDPKYKKKTLRAPK